MTNTRPSNGSHLGHFLLHGISITVLQNDIRAAPEMFVRKREDYCRAEAVTSSCQTSKPCKSHVLRVARAGLQALRAAATTERNTRVAKHPEKQEPCPEE